MDFFKIMFSGPYQRSIKEAVDCAIERALRSGEEIIITISDGQPEAPREIGEWQEIKGLPGIEGLKKIKDYDLYFVRKGKNKPKAGKRKGRKK